MKRFLILLTTLLVPGLAFAEDSKFTRTEDVIYGRKFGMCLTLDVFTPTERPNGQAVIFAESGGWWSSKDNIKPEFYKEFLNRGYVVFAVLHSSQPKFAIPEYVQDMHRAIRFIRHRAKEYKIDPDKLGIVGHSAGGHLALLQAFAPEEGDKTAKDPVDREHSRVAVVAAFAAPTDFLNWGEVGKANMGDPTRPGVFAAFEFPKMMRETLSFDIERDPKKRDEIKRAMSPASRVTSAAPPVLLIYGDKDGNVPPQQTEWLAAKLKAEKVPHEVILKKGAGHSWKELPTKDMGYAADWFAKQTVKK
jgi:acetyl esterase/lipase